MSHINGRRPRLVAAGSAVTVVLALAACGTGDDKAEAASGPVELRMVTWSANEGHHELFNAIADDYVAANPDKVSAITFDALPGANYVNALTTQIAGGDAPDLAWVSEANAVEFVQSGVLYDLTPTFEATEGYALDDLLDGATAPWSTDEGLFGYPFSNSPFGVYVNLDLLEAAGQPDPRELLASGEWTWDTVMDMSQAVAETQGTGGFIPSANPYTAWNDALGAMWMSWGGQPWSDDGTTCEFDSPEMTEFFEWFHHEVWVDHSTPQPGEEFNFKAGSAAMQLTQLSASTGLDGSFRWDFLPMPTGPAGQVDVVGQAGIGVTSLSENPEVAADFLAFFTNAANGERLAAYFPPPRESLLTVETIQKAAPALNEDQIQGTIIDAALEAETKPGHIAMSSFADSVRADLDALWEADADVPSVLAEVCVGLEPTLAGS